MCAADSSCAHRPQVTMTRTAGVTHTLVSVKTRKTGTWQKQWSLTPVACFSQICKQTYGPRLRNSLGKFIC